MKIQMGQSDAVNRKWTDNTMGKRKKAKNNQQKAKDRATRSQLKTGPNLGVPDEYAVSAPLIATVVVTLVTILVISHE